MILTLIVFLLILSILVLIHEAGHFFVARKLGIKVEEFGFGLPPRAFGIKKGETIYSINWIPIGGFVKLYGEDEAGSGKIAVKEQKTSAADKHRAFFVKPWYERAAVVVAGVVMNSLLAILVFYIFLVISNFRTELPLLGAHTFFLVNQKNANLNDTDTIVSYISPNSPAQKAGIPAHAEMISINGKNVSTRAAFIDVVNANKGKILTLVWKDTRDNSVHTVSLVPRVSPPNGEGPMGIGFVPVALLSYDTPVQKLMSGVVHPLNLLSYTIDVMGKLISISIEKKSAAPVSQGVSGPIGIFSLVQTILNIPSLKEIILQLLNLIGILSVSLAFFNVLPIPALDGGRLFFILIEGVIGRRIHQRFEATANAIGMAFLLTLIAVISLKDLLQSLGIIAGLR